MNLDQELANELIAKRRDLGIGNYDEVSEGVYMMASARYSPFAFRFVSGALSPGIAVRKTRTGKARAI